MTARMRRSTRQDKASPYASREDFSRIFDENLDELHRLSLLLTGDQKKAEQCLVTGIEDCVNGNSVFKEWAHSWAKRVIIENAIRDLKPRPSQPSSLPAAIASNTLRASPLGEDFSADAVLVLQDFERFVFVMSVLEHYSPHQCSLLLGCRSSEVREARGRALESVAAARHVDSLASELSGS